MQFTISALAVLLAVASASHHHHHHHTSYETVDTAVSAQEFPKTNFQCSDKPYVPGIYADVETHCQAYHFCTPHWTHTFLCGEGTAFNQKTLTCDYPQNFTCAETSQYYSATAGIGVETGAVTPQVPATGFTCSNVPHPFGLYADVKADCRVFHYCAAGEQSSFSCPEGTRFNQQNLICDYAENVFNCANSADYFFVNENIGKANSDAVYTVSNSGSSSSSSGSGSHAQAHSSHQATSSHHQHQANAHHHANTATQAAAHTAAHKPAHFAAHTATHNAGHSATYNAAQAAAQNAAHTATHTAANSAANNENAEDSHAAEHTENAAHSNAATHNAAHTASHTASHTAAHTAHAPAAHYQLTSWVRPNNVEFARQGGSAHTSTSHHQQYHHASHHATSSHQNAAANNQASVHQNAAANNQAGAYQNAPATNQAGAHQNAAANNQASAHQNAAANNQANAHAHYTHSRVSTFVKPAAAAVTSNTHYTSNAAAGNFVCPTFNHQMEGYFADVQSGCAAYHRCVSGRLVGTFYCGQNSFFNQVKLACDYTSGSCQAAPRFYEQQFFGKEEATN